MEKINNILFVVPDFYPNSTGFANAAFNLAKVISSYNEYKVHVFCNINLGGFRELEGMSIYRYTNHAGGKLSKWLRERKQFHYVEQIVEEQQIDVIFFETNTFSYLQYWLLKKYDEKVFVRLHSTADTEMQIWASSSTIGSRINRKLVFEFMNEVHNIIATGSYYLDFAQKYYFDENVYKIWNRKVYGIIHNTVDTPRWESQRVMRNTYITLGKMSEFGIMQKGMTDLIRALYIMDGRNELPDDFKLLLIGGGMEYGRLKEFISDLMLEKRICMIEEAEHEEVLSFINDSKAAILLSRFEGQSMFLTEALSLGKPLVISRDTGASDLVVDGVNGYHVHMGDSMDIAEKLNALIQMEDGEIEKMGNESKKMFDKQFSNAAVYEQFRNAINLRYRGM